MIRLKINKVMIFVAVFVVLAVSTYFYFKIFLIKEECASQQCFLENMAECKGTAFNSMQEDAVWAYAVQGTQGGSCKVSVKVVEVKKSTSSEKDLEGKEMTCYVPKGMLMMPEEKIEYCHGLLKEAIQDQIIERMHLYIVQKIGQIEQEFGIVNQTAINQTGNSTAANSS